MKLIAALAAVLAVVGSGCGATKPGAPLVSARCRGVLPQQLRERRQLQRDLVTMRRAASPLRRQTLMGSPAIQKATGAFLDDVDRSSLPNLVQSRYFAYAGAIASAVCEQCFQMIEADRPVAGGAKLGPSC